MLVRPIRRPKAPTPNPSPEDGGGEFEIGNPSPEDGGGGFGIGLRSGGVRGHKWQYTIRWAVAGQRIEGIHAAATSTTVFLHMQ